MEYMIRTQYHSSNRKNKNTLRASGPRQALNTAVSKNKPEDGEFITAQVENINNGGKWEFVAKRDGRRLQVLRRTKVRSP